MVQPIVLMVPPPWTKLVLMKPWIHFVEIFCIFVGLVSTQFNGSMNIVGRTMRFIYGTMGIVGGTMSIYGIYIYGTISISGGTTSNGHKVVEPWALFMEPWALLVEPWPLLVEPRSLLWNHELYLWNHEHCWWNHECCWWNHECWKILKVLLFIINYAFV